MNNLNSSKPNTKTSWFKLNIRYIGIISLLNIVISLLLYLLLFNKENYIIQELLIMYFVGIVGIVIFSIYFYIMFFRLKTKYFKLTVYYFLVGTCIGLLWIIYWGIKEGLVYLIAIIPILNIFCLCLYIRIYYWSVEREQILNLIKKNKIKKDEEKIVI